MGHLSRSLTNSSRLHEKQNANLPILSIPKGLRGHGTRGPLLIGLDSIVFGKTFEIGGALSRHQHSIQITSRQRVPSNAN